MEDNTSSDDEIQDSPISPKMGGKKLKLNDGSSQESLKDSAGSSNKEDKDENVDSGVSAGKSESTSSDDRTTAGEGPSNQVVNAAPTSSSNIQAILLNFSRPRRLRNYRKRKTPDRDSDSNDSSRDSDDLSAAETTSTPELVGDSNSDAESDDINRIMSFPDGSVSSSSSSNSSDDSGSEDINMMPSGDTDSEFDEPWNREGANEETDDHKGKVNSVLGKTRPGHKYILPREIFRRETGLTATIGKTTKSDVMFEQRFYGSLHSVYRMKKLHTLQKHRGCVNSINFHPEGTLLASGSDDMNVVVWDWARNVALQTVRTGHKSNVFQSKFLHLNARSQLNIVTCARDGQVRLVQCPSSGGGGAVRRRLAAHSRPAHKLHVWPRDPHLVVSCGEDGLVMQCDVRQDHATRLFHVKYHGITIPLYSVCGHPLDTDHLLVAGRDKFVRVYDRRATSKPYACYSPSTFEDNNSNANAKNKKPSRLSTMHLTCAMYNHDGSEILGTYNDEDIYLFDTKHDVFDKDNPTGKEGFTHRYSGHRNSATFKGVAFFGPKSEYVVSGSDCSHIYIWEKESEAIVQFLRGDVNGVVNCIETHPRSPVMATSGLDSDVKIWIPRNHKDPTFEGLEKVVRENIILGSQFRSNSPLFNDFLPALYSAWRTESRMYSEEDMPVGNVQFDENVCSII